MMTLNDLCAHLLPPDEHLKFKTLHIGEQGMGADRLINTSMLSSDGHVVLLKTLCLRFLH